MAAQNHSPLRVLLINEYFYPDNQGGVANATSNIARGLRDAQGADVHVIAATFAYRDQRHSFSKRETWDGVEIHRVASPAWNRKSVAMRFAGNLAFGLLASWRALWIPKPDVVLVTTSPLLGPIAAKLLAGLRGIPYVYIVYDLDPDRTVALGLKSEEARSVKLLRRWQSSWLKGAAGIVAIGRCMNDYLVRTYGLVRDRVHTVEVGADPNVVRPLPRETEFRKRENLNGFVVLYSGNFGQYHDFDTLLGAAEILKKSHPQVQFALVGGGHKREYVAEEVKRRNLDNVRLFGFVPEEELADLLASADLSVVTLEPGMEGLCVPSKFYTCLASGRPVLALMNPNCEVAYAVEESQCGMCAPIGEPETVAKAIVTLAESPERRATMGANSRHVFDQKYAMPVITGRIAEILRDVVDAKRRGASR